MDDGIYLVCTVVFLTMAILLLATLLEWLSCRNNHKANKNAGHQT